MAKQLADNQHPDADLDQGAPHWRRTLWSVWIAHMLANVGFSFCMPFLPFYVRELGVTDERLVGIWAGAAITSAGIALAVFSPIWGWVADRVGRKLMLMRCMIGGAFVIAVLGLAQTAPQLVFLRLLQGAVTGTGAACNTLVASSVPRARLGYAMGVMQTAIIVGCSIGPWLGGLVADQYGYRIPFFLCGGLWLIAGLVVGFGAHERFVRPDQCPTNGNGLREAFGGKGAVAVLGMCFLGAFSMMFVVPIFPLFVEKISPHVPPATATGMLIGIAGIAAGIACVTLGKFGERTNQGKLLVWTSAAAGLLSFPHALATSFGQLVVLRVGWGLATGAMGPLANSMIGANVAAETYGRAFGTIQAAQCLGIALGPLAGGFVASAVGMRLPFVIMGCLLIISAALIAAWVKPKEESAGGQ